MKITIKKLRLLSERSQKEVANQIGISRYTLMKWEKDSDLIPVGYAKKLCEIYGADYESIFFG